MIASTIDRVDLGDGTATTVERWGEAGPVLLCVHGIGSSRRSWVRLADHFAASFRVVAYDQRGHGDSAHVGGPMTHERSLLDLERVVAALDAPVFGLVGHSWGGAIALLGGRRIACDRVIAIDPMIRQPAGSWNADYVDGLRAVLAAPEHDRTRLIRDLYAPLPPVEIDAKVHAMHAMSVDPIVALGAENAADAGGWDLRESVRAYPKPLYLPIADPADSVVSAGDLAFVRDHGGPRIEVEVYAGEGHSLQRTAFEKFAAHAERFLRA
jgi:pimeloyl-ACP methyl ester carboxylesterase